MVVFDPPQFSVRLIDVLFDFGLPERRASAKNNPMEIARESIDWNAVRVKKAAFSSEATAFLDSAFGVRGEVFIHE